MNKKEIAEIKKQFTPDRCSITRICGCYVDGEKNKKPNSKKPSYPYQRKKPSNTSTSSEKPSPAPSEKTSSTWNFLWIRKPKAEPKTSS